MNRVLATIAWALVALIAAGSLAVLALSNGETVNAAWLVAAAIGSFLIGYRFYSRFIAERVLRLDATRPTPALRHADGMDYVATDRRVLFGHHFAAIAGAGPLIGPVLAAQMGYLPGTLWIIAGVILAGAVQDFTVLLLSLRRDGRSLGEMIRSEMGAAAGITAMIGILAIMIILLAVLALVVVKALAISPWGSFTVAATIPIALLMGVYLRWLRPGRVLEVSLLGLGLLLGAVWLGGRVAADPAWASAFTLDAPTLAYTLIGYGFVAAALPVWLLLAPRDYLSTFLKLGTIFLLAIAIFLTLPTLHMPALTRFVDGDGPVWKGGLFPFLFIVIACGSVSGFHALISSGTTPKMLASEADARAIGYGAMLLEAFVAIMALVAACVLQPGVYFAMNAPAGVIGHTVTSAAQTISGWGFAVTPQMLGETARQIGESTILSRAGGAPTLAVGMAQILHQLAPAAGLMAFWYHYAILFEALFILTTLDAGTRVARFMLQDTLGLAWPALRRSDSLSTNLATTGLAVLAWGYFLIQGVRDPLGGINTLWPLFGIANQMLAAIALIFVSVALAKMKRDRHLWVALLPTAWLVICTLTAGWQKLFSSNPAIGFLAAARHYTDAAAAGQLLAPAQSLADMLRIADNQRVDALLCALFMVVVVLMIGFGLREIRRARRSAVPTTAETPHLLGVADGN